MLREAGGGLNRVLYRDALPQGPTLTLLYTVEPRLTDNRFIRTRRRTIFFVPRESSYIFLKIQTA